MQQVITPATGHVLSSHPAIRFMFAYAGQDLDGMMRYCEPQGEVWFKPLGEQGRGTINELGSAIWSSLIECFPDIKNEVHAAVEQDGEIRCQVLIEGTQAKDFAGIVSKGLCFSSDHIFVFRLDKAGKIDRIHIEWDHADFQRQLSA